MPRFRLYIPFSALHFDFDKSGWGECYTEDRFGHMVKLKVAIVYPLTADPLPHNCKVISARLIKNRRGFDLDPNVVKIKKG